MDYWGIIPHTPVLWINIGSFFVVLAKNIHYIIFKNITTRHNHEEKSKVSIDLELGKQRGAQEKYCWYNNNGSTSNILEQQDPDAIHNCGSENENCDTQPFFMCPDQIQSEGNFEVTLMKKLYNSLMKVHMIAVLVINPHYFH